MTPRELEGSFRRALAQMDPRSRVAAALRDMGGESTPGDAPSRAVSVIAVGKAAPSMAAGVLDRWGAAVRDVLVVTNDGTDVSAIGRDRRVEIVRASHPVPDRRSVAAAERCLDRAKACAGERDHSLVLLVSGGASSLVCAPARGTSLREKQAVTRAMLKSGASIQEMNVVRRHLSRIKGGGLARAARPCPVLTVVMSDVIDGAIGDVGSGPGVGDRTTVGQARRLLQRYVPSHADLPLVRTGAADNVVDARIVAAPEDLARVMAAELGARGVRSRVLAPSQRAVSELATEYIALARRLRSGMAVVRAAEPWLVVPSNARRGGRCTHLAALVGLGLPAGAMFLAAATDGVDGSSATGGALVSDRFAARVGERAIRRALGRFDSGALHRSAKTALPFRPAGHNLADLHVLLMR